MKRALLPLLLLLAPATGRAQLAPPLGSDCVPDGDNVPPLPGTATWSAAAHSVFGTTALYGAVGTLENEIFPNLDFAQAVNATEGLWKTGAGGEGVWAMHLSYRMTQNLLRLPMCTGRMSALDGVQQNVAAAYRMPVLGDDGVSFFYAMSLGYTTLIDNPDDAMTSRIGVPLGFAFAPLVLVPYFTATGNDRLGAPPEALISEWVAGVSYTKHLPVTDVTASAAFVSSRGAFLSLSESTWGFSVGTVLSSDFQKPRYLSYGFRDLALGTTLLSLYGTRMELIVPPPMSSKAVTIWYADHFDDVRDELPHVRHDIYTASVDNIAQLFDLGVSVMHEPEAGFQSASLRVHAPWYHAARMAPGAVEMDGETLALAVAMPLSLRAGAVALPRYGYFGQDAVTLPFVELELGILYLRYNAPEFLTLFPYAKGLLQVGLEVTLAF